LKLPSSSRPTRVRITKQGQPTIEWHYKGPRKDLNAIYEAMTMAPVD